jgi:cytochrome c-type biogenesis protein CcmH
MIALAIVLAASAGADGLEERAQSLEMKLVSPCCFRQVLRMHDSDPSRTMKAEIRRDLEAGRSEEAILAGYVERYGIQILSEPPAVGFHRFLTAAPAVAFVASLAALVVVLHRWRRRAAPMHLEELSSELKRRIEQDLRALGD